MDKKTRWYKEAIIYQIYPFSFMDGNNDGMGDIEGIIQKLDYLKNLGITAIWFSPLYDSPNKDYGYDIRDYRKIAEAFGTMDDFKTLLDECHKREIKVIMDMVVNHTSNEHEWFKKAMEDENSPYRDYYIIRKGIKKGNKLLPPNNWKSTFTGSAWERIKDTDDFYLHLFTIEQPDLNWENENVREEIIDILNFYLSMGVDGFRFDVFNLFSKVEGLPSDKRLFAFPKGGNYYIDGPRIHEFLHELNTKALSLYDSMSVGESMMPNEEDALKYIDESSAELDTLFNFAHMTSDNLFGLKYLKKKFNLKEFKDGFFKPQEKYYENGWNTLVIENHDNPRCISRFGIDTKNYRYEAATFIPTILYMGFGTPYIYEGQEFGMINNEFSSLDELMDPVSHFIYNIAKKIPSSKKWKLNTVLYGARDHARVPVAWDDSINGGFNKGTTPWMKVSTTYKEINAKKDLESDKSVYKYYQRIIDIKKTNKTIIYGKTQEYSHNNKKVIAYTRTLDDSKYFIVGNFSNKPVEYKVPDDLVNLTKVISNYDDTNYSNGTISFRPYEAIVFEAKNS
ncbi:alpha-glucosidase [bacterium]|nr:alpha-glucosidase [bacterium]